MSKQDHSLSTSLAKTQHTPIKKSGQKHGLDGREATSRATSLIIPKDMVEAPILRRQLRFLAAWNQERIDKEYKGQDRNNILREAHNLMGGMNQYMIPATKAEIIKMITLLIVTYAPRNLQAEEKQMRLMSYLAVLHKVPRSAFFNAIQDILNDPKIEWLPTPAKIKQISREYSTIPMQNQFRLNAIIRKFTSEPKEIEYVPAEKLKELKERLSGLTKQIPTKSSS